MSSPPIQPRTLKGFRDYLPEVMIPREQIIDTARRVFRSYGFSPIDTPALEYLEILLGKGGTETDKQLYRFQDHGGRDVGLRFDLTVPLARFAAQHINELGTPFKRYHIANVWRGENTQRGRYREFMQCDFDTIGTNGIAADAETVLVVHDLLHAIGFERYTIRVNNRMVLSGILETAGLRADATAVLRSLDKIHKIGAKRVQEEIKQVPWLKLQIDAIRAQIKGQVALEILESEEFNSRLDDLAKAANECVMTEIGHGTIKTFDQAQSNAEAFVKKAMGNLLNQIYKSPSIKEKIDQLTYTALTKELTPVIESLINVHRILSAVNLAGSNNNILSQLNVLVGHSDVGKAGVRQLRELLTLVLAAGIPESRIKVDVSIARGLDYYTGTVLETTLDDLPDIGSVCSGGRYDNLADLYTKQQLPGIGASLGLDRLLAAMEELGMLPAARTPAQVFIPYFDATRLGEYFQLAQRLRSAGIATEVYPEPVKLGKQLQYADKKGFRIAIVAGEREFDAGECQVKDLASGSSGTASLTDDAAELVAEVQRILAT